MSPPSAAPAAEATQAIGGPWISTFEVRKDDFSQTRWSRGQRPADLPAGQILVEIEKFALTANNVSYAVAGDRIGYWDYFPAAEPGWGRLPAFGFGKVVASRCAAVPIGRYFYGYFPMASHVLMQPGRVTERGFVDGLGGRAQLHDAYNTYYAWGGARGPRLDLFPVLNPLFMTSWLYFNHLSQKGYFGAEQVILVGASSKTAAALAYFLSRPRSGRRVSIGITSAANLGFVVGLGRYDQVIAYGDTACLLDLPSVVVDFAGNGEAVHAVHSRLGDLIKLSSRIGQTHWNAERAPKGMPGPKPSFFFAPGHVQDSVAIWGEEAFHEQADQAWRDFHDAAQSWFTVDRGRGPEALEQVFRGFLDGRVDPSRAHVLSVGG